MSITGEDCGEVSPPAPIRASLLFAKYETALHRGIDWCTRDPGRASAVLVLLCLVFYVPGIFSRPPIDRTEVRYALSSEHLVESGDLMVPREEEQVRIGRPIGILWLQGLSTRLLGPKTNDAIWAYRLPSLAGATLAVLLLFLGMRAAIGEQAAFCASVLLALTVPLAIQARLALPQAGALAAAVVAQTSLARLYLGQAYLSQAARNQIILVLWVALGAGTLVNSLIVPVVSLLTIAGLYVQDRSLKWLGGKIHVLGLLIALVLASPWAISFWLSIADPSPDPDHSPVEWLSLIMDSQAMNHRAFPGSYVLTTWLAFAPCLLLFAAACLLVWRNRSLPLMRFLLAWLVPYLIAFELTSHKPPLYMVEYVLPAVAIAMALCVTKNPITGAPQAVWAPAVSRVGWVAFGLFLGSAPLVFQYLAGERLDALMLIASAGVVAGFAATAAAWPHIGALAATSFSLAGIALFYWLMTALILQPSSRIWPSVRIAELTNVMRACYPQAPVIAGYTEPSGRFLLEAETIVGTGAQAAAYLEAYPRALAFVEQARVIGFSEASRQLGPAPAPVEIACVSGWNVFTSGRAVQLRVYVKPPPPADAACIPPVRYRCVDAAPPIP